MDTLSPKTVPAMVYLYNEWLWRMENKFFDSPCNAVHCFFSQWLFSPENGISEIL